MAITTDAPPAPNGHSPEPAVDEVPCLECQAAGNHNTFKDNRLLGLHRRRMHNIAGASAGRTQKSRDRKKRKAPADKPKTFALREMATVTEEGKTETVYLLDQNDVLWVAKKVPISLTVG